MAACMLCDKHIVKMSLESAQMLTNCFSRELLDAENTPRTLKGNPRKYSYWNHPSSVWVRETRGNMDWLVLHAIEICKEKKRRYPDAPMPFVYEFLRWAQDNANRSEVPPGLFTTPPQCMPEERKIKGDTVKAYRDYYRKDKAKIVQWGRSPQPAWFS